MTIHRATKKAREACGSDPRQRPHCKGAASRGARRLERSMPPREEHAAWADWGHPPRPARPKPWQQAPRPRCERCLSVVLLLVAFLVIGAGLVIGGALALLRRAALLLVVPLVLPLVKVLVLLLVFVLIVLRPRAAQV